MGTVSGDFVSERANKGISGTASGRSVPKDNTFHKVSYGLFPASPRKIKEPPGGLEALLRIVKLEFVTVLR